eukprot:scaffold58728_cov52-Attheya_sp.AAC.2
METGTPQEQDEAETNKPMIRTRRRIKRVLPLTDEEVRTAEGFGTDNNNNNDKMSAEWKILVENDKTDWLRSYLKVVLDLNAHYQRGKPRTWHFGHRSWWGKQQTIHAAAAASSHSTAGTVSTAATFFEQLRDMRFFYHDKIPLHPKTKSGQIVRAKLNLLDNIGFPWDIQADLGQFCVNVNTINTASREDTCREEKELDSARQEWANYHEELQLYLQTRGDTMVPSHTELGIWCVQQRLRHSNGKLGKEQTEALAVLGFSFSMTRQVDWNDMYNELQTFREEWKHTCVWPPETLGHINTSPYASLARWCQRQRVEYKFFQETQKRQAAIMEASKEQPQKETNNQEHEDGPKVAKKKGRDKPRDRKLKVRNCVLYEGPVTSTLTQELIDKLDALEFIWDTSLDYNWCQLFRQLQEYYKEHGHSNPKMGSHELSRWIFNTRVRNKSEMEQAENIKLVAVTPLKKKLLSLVEFSWHVATIAHISWEERYATLLQFRATEGHCLVPQLHPTLGEWVKHQRAAYDKLMRGVKSDRRLTPDMIAKLDAIGFVWRLRHTSRGKHNRATTGSSSGVVVDTTNTTTHKKTTATATASSKRKQAPASSTLAKHHKAARKAEILEASSNEDDQDSEGNEESESEEEDEDEQEEADAFYGGSHDDEEEEDNNDVELEPPADVNNKVVVVPQQTASARHNMLAEMKCGLCSGIMVGATACVPCGHSFCETCLVLQVNRNNRSNCCTRCGSAIHDTVCQRHMDSIIFFTVEGGEFTPEETALFHERSNNSNNSNNGTTNNATTSSICINNAMMGDHAGGSNWNQQEQQQQQPHHHHHSEHYHTNAPSYLFQQQQQQHQQQSQNFVSPRRRNLF